jgi:Leucine-rich repeat (LRR) protein
MWEDFNYCQLNAVDLSETFKTVEHLFSGTAEQKSAATAVYFTSPVKIEILPKQLLNDFPRLNGIVINDSDTFTTIKNGFFAKEFGAIQHLGLWNNKIETIEADAFQCLPKLKWIDLDSNQLHSLPHQIFKNNPELIAISLNRNKINSITPDFFKNLNKLRYVSFYFNQCLHKNFGCDYECSVSQSELESAFSHCYQNCLQDGECAPKSRNVDNLGSKETDQNTNLTVSNEIGNLKNESLEPDAQKFEEILQVLKDLKVQQLALWNNLTSLIQAHYSELKQELSDLKIQLAEK